MADCDAIIGYVGEAHREEQQALDKQNDTAVEAGNKLGGDFTDDRKKAGGK